MERTYPCPACEGYESQVGAYQAMGINDILEHAQIGGKFLSIVLDRSENCDGKSV